MIENKTLYRNTIFLYLLTFSNYFFSFITVPYQTRIFGPEVYGVLGFASAFSVYFMLFIDFGFTLSATKSVAEHRENRKYLTSILSNITFVKICFAIFSLIILSVLSMFIKYLNENYLILLLYTLLAGLNSLIPDYIYRGIEDMKKIALRTVVVRAIFTLLIFIFLKNKTQIYLVPIFSIVGAITALSIAYYDLAVNFCIKVIKPSLVEMKALIIESSPYFLSRISSSICDVSNTVILGFANTPLTVIGLYSSAEKLRGVANQAYTPIADSLYPYLMRTKDYEKMFKIMLICQVAILLGAVILWRYSDYFCIFLFGKEFIEAGEILRWMLPVIFITLPSYILGFPALTPLGVARWANYSVELSVGCQIVGLIILVMMNNISVYSLIGVMTISEFVCFFCRLLIFVKYYARGEKIKIT